MLVYLPLNPSQKTLFFLPPALVDSDFGMVEHLYHKNENHSVKPWVYISPAPMDLENITGTEWSACSWES